MLTDLKLNKNIGLFLKAKRESMNLTQGEVASQLGYSSPQFISNIERGLCAPPIKSLKKLAQLYSVSKTEIIELILKEQERLLTSALDN